MGRAQNQYNYPTKDITVHATLSPGTFGNVTYEAYIRLNLDPDSITQTTQHKESVPEVLPTEPILVGIGGVINDTPVGSDLNRNSVQAVNFFMEDGSYTVYIKLSATTLSALNNGKATAYAKYSMTYGGGFPHTVFGLIKIVIVDPLKAGFNWDGAVGFSGSTCELDINTNTCTASVAYSSYRAFNDAGRAAGSNPPRWAQSCPSTGKLTLTSLANAILNTAPSNRPPSLSAARDEGQIISILRANKASWSVTTSIISSDPLSLNQVVMGKIVGNVYTYNGNGISVGDTILSVSGVSLVDLPAPEVRFASAIQTETFTPPGSQSAAETKLRARCLGNARFRTTVTYNAVNYVVEEKNIAVRIPGMVVLRNYTPVSEGTDTTYDPSRINDPAACPAYRTVKYYKVKFVPLIISGAREMQRVTLATKTIYSKPDASYLQLVSDNLTLSGDSAGGSITSPLGSQWGGGSGESFGTVTKRAVNALVISGIPGKYRELDSFNVSIVASLGTRSAASIYLYAPPQGVEGNTKRFPCWEGRQQL